ncbi:MAG TPA: 50S ribosomal protein L34 [Thermoplasmata archaeon]|nr:50S ribosomal protein L34 [Thermoplasmata archaeon]
MKTSRRSFVPRNVTRMRSHGFAASRLTCGTGRPGIARAPVTREMNRRDRTSAANQ